MTLDLNGVALVATIAQHGSFAAAARELGKVPSALTYSVRKLEEELDVLLFDRRGQRALLTPAGRTLLTDGTRLLDEADSLVKRVKQIGSGWESELGIGVDALIDFQALAPLLADFDALGAPTRLRLTYEVFNGTWQALTDQRVALAIGASGPQPPVGALQATQMRRFYSAPLGAIEFVFCIAPTHPLNQVPIEQALTDDDIRPHRAVVLADTSNALSGTLAAASIGIVDGQPCITVATLEQKIRAQVAGLGVGFVPKPFARPWLDRGELVSRTVINRRGPGRVYYAWAGPQPGKALSWWLGKLGTRRVQQKLLAGPRQ